MATSEPTEPTKNPGKNNEALDVTVPRHRSRVRRPPMPPRPAKPSADAGSQVPTSSTNAETIEETLPARSPRVARPTSRTDEAAKSRALPPTKIFHPAVVAPTATAFSATPITDDLQRFQLGDELGRGGLGVVRLALDDRLQRQVAVKLLHRADDRTEVSRFVEEAQITGQLEHPNIVPVHELGTDAAGRPFLTMKRVQGTTLAERIDQWRAAQTPSSLAELRRDDRIRIFRAICNAMDYAHNRGVIHRDLKPANIMVGAFGEVLVMDWGLAKILDSPTATKADRPEPAVRSPRRATGDLEATVDGDVIGTPAYMAPEQALGEITAMTPATDVFALGAILYAMMVYEAPYSGKSLAELVAKAATCQFVPPRQRAPQRQIPPALEAIIMTAMAADPRDRYTTVANLRADLDALVADESVRVYRFRLHERVARWVRKHPTLSVASMLSMVFAVLFVAGAAMAWSQVAEADARREVEVARVNSQKFEAETERIKAERIAEAERLRVMIQQGQIRELAQQLGVRFDQETADIIREFESRFDRASRDYVVSLDEMRRALSEVELRRYRAAFEAMARAHDQYGPELVPMAGRHWLNLARLVVLESGDWERAARLLDRAVTDDPAYPNSRLDRAIARRMIGDHAGAAQDLAYLVEHYETIASVHYELAQLRQNQGDPVGARRALDRAIALNPTDPDAWAARAVLHAERGAAEAAIADANRALGLDSAHAVAYANRALALALQGKFEAAKSDADRAVQLVSDDPKIWVRRAIVRRLAQDLPGSNADCAKALDLDPRHAIAHYHLGINLMMQRQWAAAADAFSAAVRLDPRHWDHYAKRGLARTQAGDTFGAVVDFTTATTLAPEIADLHAERGKLLTQINPVAIAVADFERAEQLAPTNWVISLNLGRLLKATGRHSEAIEALQRAHRNCPDAAEKAMIVREIRQLGGTPPH